MGSEMCIRDSNMCVCSTNIGFSGGKICACVRLILVLVGGRQTAIVVAHYDSMVPGTYTYYVPDTYVPGSRQKSIRTYVRSARGRTRLTTVTSAVARCSDSYCIL